MVWDGRNLKAHLALGRGTFHYPRLFQPGFGPFQRRGSHSFSGQPMPGPHRPHREEFPKIKNFLGFFNFVFAFLWSWDDRVVIQGCFSPSFLLTLVWDCAFLSAWSC